MAVKALNVALRVENFTALVVVDAVQFRPATALNVAVVLDATGVASNKTLAGRVRLCAQAAAERQAELGAEREAAQEAQRRVFPDGWDYAQRLPLSEFRALPPKQRQEYSRLNREAAAKAAQVAAAPAVVSSEVPF